MGANESNPVRNMDKRTARREYREDFLTAIRSYRERYQIDERKEDRERERGIESDRDGDIESDREREGGERGEDIDRRKGKGKIPYEERERDLERDFDWNTSSIRVCVRKRPIFKDEIQHYEFDVITCLDDGTIVIHDARMHSDMKRQFLNHHKFKFDHIFNEECKNNDVYDYTAKPMTKFAFNGGFATCLMYGQTGSGILGFFASHNLI
jgi:hypothetical protein